MEGMEGVEGPKTKLLTPGDQNLDPPHALHFSPLPSTSRLAPFSNITVPLDRAVPSLPGDAAFSQRWKGPTVRVAGAVLGAKDAKLFRVHQEIAQPDLARFPPQSRHSLTSIPKQAVCKSG